MKYYLVVLKSDSQSVTAYTTQDGALAAFHHEMEYAITAHIATTCIVTDTYGSQIKAPERFDPPVPIAEETHEPN